MAYDLADACGSTNSLHRLAATTSSGYRFDMKSATVQQVPQQWAQILRWIDDGEEVQVTQQDTIVAKLVPVTPARPLSSPILEQPDFLARARAIWGEKPAGKPVSAIVDEARGSQS